VGAGYPTAGPRIAAGFGLIAAAMLGAAAYRRAASFHRSAVLLVFLATAATLAGLQVAQRFGGIHTHTLATSDYIGLAAVQGSYAVVLLAVRALRLR